jgi:hypothetical protein
MNARHPIVGAALAALALTATACSGGGPPAPPVHSATVACKDFEKWFLVQPQGNIATGKDSGELTRAVGESPSGNLYQAMSTLAADAQTAHAAAGTSLGQPEEDYTVNDASNVENICQSVNPNS